MKQQHIDGLDDLLQTLSFDRPPNDFEYIVASPATQQTGIDSSGQPVSGETREIRIYYSSLAKFPFKALIKLLEQQLRNASHSSNREIALAVLALYLILRPFDNRDQALLFEILADIVTTEATLFFIYPLMRPQAAEVLFKPFGIGPYDFGYIKLGQLKRLSNQAKSDYFARYESQLRGRYAITRTFTDAKVINWFRFRKPREVLFSLNGNLTELFNKLVSNYFDSVSAELFNKFFAQMLEEQHLLIALDSIFVSPDSLERIPAVEKLTIYHKVDHDGENGFVYPIVSAPALFVNPRLKSSISSTLENLKNKFEFTEFLDNEIDHTLQTYTRLISRAKRHKLEGNLDEAFLHFIIALDMVFGEANESTASVSRRVSTLIYRDTEKSFPELFKQIQQLYGARSKYVHKGVSPIGNLIEQVDFICSKVLNCLLRLHLYSINNKAPTIKDWLKRIDILAMTIEVGDAPEMGLLDSIGVFDRK